MIKCELCEYNNNCSIQKIAKDITGCEGHSKSITPDKSEYQCESCKKIFKYNKNGITINRIFPRKHNKQYGLCFDCY